jgi:hypothetical protein
MERPVKNAVKGEFKEVGSLHTAERVVWPFDIMEKLPHGGFRLVATGMEWVYEGALLPGPDGVRRLVATGCRPQHAPAIPEGPELLLSLLNLVTQPIPWERVDEAVAAEDACTWCKTYGLPVVESTNALARHQPQLSLSLFQREVLTLVLLWNVWRALFYKDKATLARDLPQLWKARASQRREATDYWRTMRLEEAESMAKRSLQELEARARSGVADLLNERLERVKLTFAWGDPTSRVHLEVVSLFDLAYLQMASLLTKPQSEIKRHYKACRICGGAMWEHGNALYCRRPCNKHMYYNRNTRGRQKAANA